MFAFAESFLKHLLTIWSQFFVSPFIIPTVFSLGLRKWLRIREHVPLLCLAWNVLFFLMEFVPVSLFASFLMTSLGRLGLAVDGGWAEVLGDYALVSHFHIGDTALLNPSSFYGDSFWAFFFLYNTFLVGNLPDLRSVKLPVLLGALAAGYMCGGLAFGIQHWVYSIDFPWGVTSIPAIALFSTVSAFSIWIILVLAVRGLSESFRRLIDSSENNIIEPVVRIVITVLILAFALSGFLFLQPYQATLWLLFWIIAYPVALSFTRGEPLKGAALTEIYVAGLKQVPVLGQIFAAYMGKPSARSPRTPSEDNGPNAKPSKPKKEQKR
jgi:hypothetical protein